MSLSSGHQPALSSGPLTPGTVLVDTYEVVQLLGRMRSFGERVYVYLGRQHQIDRDVIIRVLASAYDPHGGSEAQERFLRDARAVSRVLHPEVIKLYDMGLTPGGNLPYAVAEWLPGKTLEAQLASEGVLAPARAMRLFSRCLEVLGQAHRAGIVHRDLTPTNLLLSHPGQPWERLRIQNFALVFLNDPSAARLTQTGQLVGDPRYLAPEYLQHGVLSPALDVYQMGLLLVESLTGSPVVAGKNQLECARAHIGGQLNVPPSLYEGAFGKVLTRALATDPRHRFADGHAFSQALWMVDPAGVSLPTEPLSSSQVVSSTLLDGQFELREEIGSGGFATVYAGSHIGSGTPVAIKIMRRRPDPERHAEFTNRFVAEAHLAVKVQHPNIVTIHHYGVTPDELPYMVMELLKGLDLETELAENGPLDPVRALPMFSACLDALGHAHAQGIVHKDLKPANLFLHRPDPEREIMKVVDFGVARMGQDEEARLTRTGQPVCTPGYAAPEYITHLRATPAVDVYQMGLILIEALTGTPVVSSQNPLTCIMAHVKGNLELPPAMMAGPLGPILRRALALKDTDRYPEGIAFARALRQIDPRSLRASQAEADRTIKVDQQELNCARAFVTALIVSQKAPHDVDKLEPLIRTCVRFGVWKPSGKEWGRLRAMIQTTITAAVSRGDSSAARRIESLGLELEQRLARIG